MKQEADKLWAQLKVSGESSADFQSAVSPNCIRHGVELAAAAETPEPVRIANPRYGRLQICATPAWVPDRYDGPELMAIFSTIIKNSRGGAS